MKRHGKYERSSTIPRPGDLVDTPHGVGIFIRFRSFVHGRGWVDADPMYSLKGNFYIWHPGDKQARMYITEDLLSDVFVVSAIEEGKDA